MDIVSIEVNVIQYLSQISRDQAGHAHAGAPSEAQIAMLRLTSDDGREGYAFAPPEVIRPYVVEQYFKKAALNVSIHARERIWQNLWHRQRGSAGQLTDRAMAVLDSALWDLAGRQLKVPVHQLLGGYRDKVKAYGSTMCGDEVSGGLSTPEEYADFANQLVQLGYKGIKLHTWMPPVRFAPSVDRDIRACEAVREAVGADIALMLDGYHWYSRTDTLKIGRALDRLNFSWFEEPMVEESMESYRWLQSKIETPIVGPETIGGKHFSRASWAKQNACDILRIGVANGGGISPCMKTAHLAEAFGMNCEIHGNGAANLAVVGAIGNCEWYERGLLHPMCDYDKPPAYLHSLIDPMDGDGYVSLPKRPGLGEDINFEYIECNTVKRY
ncbi:mandelate racemase family protein [Marinomonas balearica]|uniref:L-alanine-DL-glutamate epimerase-like enolase superfamily enzyme n=1 Tax=Marinomonas balearica TaxID=491947 RepID=A0A4R6MH46_9GAMM|nr:mandelate racemase family protein [Marinomonas balearica]TDP01259.1 L-alanine-DL-glutamate epimerase-like enolase superfamily enzyme [Marinomonas balearica]